MRKKHLRLVSPNGDPSDIFNDLDRLQQISAGGHQPRKQRSSEAHLFARIPYDRALDLYRQHKISGAAWIVLFELDRVILKHRGQNPVKFISTRLKEIGIKKETRARALRQLKAAGVIRIEQRGSGLAPWVRHFWYPERP
jgi:hypothetical protein